MFTGLIEQTGELIAARSSSILLRPERRFSGLTIGESIAVNGCCLTLEEERNDGVLRFHTLAETLRCTNLGSLPAGSPLNLERALRLGDRFGGHIVQGHVDAVARVLSLARQPDGDIELRLELPDELRPEIVLKGSITVDGVSLTVCALSETDFAVRLIPETLAVTALSSRRPGTPVNLETDVIGKYVAALLHAPPSPPRKPESAPITMERLFEEGFR